MRTSTDRTRSDTLGIPVYIERPAYELASTAADLEIGCIFCREQLPANQAVLFWRIGESFVCACIQCALHNVEGFTL
jgi:hypothetical protein